MLAKGMTYYNKGMRTVKGGGLGGWRHEEDGYHHVASVEKDIRFMKKISATSMIMLENCE